MSNRNPRNIQLLSQISDANPFKKALAPAFDLVDDLEKDLEAVRLDRRLSPEGRKEVAQGHLRKTIRDLRDLRKPIDEFRSKTEELRATAKKLPPYDKTDIVAALNRREMRDRSCLMTAGQRAGKLTGPNRSLAFIDAVLEHVDDPWMSGINIYEKGELDIYEIAKQERLRDLHGPLLDTIAQRDSIEAEALMILNVARTDIAADSGLESREFEAIAKPVESKANAPWLRKEKDAAGNERTIVIDVQNHRSRAATEREILDGKYYASHQEYLADRSAA
jgi:hypothetical protein